MEKYQKRAADICFSETADFNASFIPSSATGALLDIGAYRGLLRERLPESLSYHGVDLQNWGLDCIKETNLNCGRIPFPDNSFDFVFATNIIEHLLIPPHGIFQEIQRVGKLSSKIIVALPNDRGVASLLFGSFGISRLFQGVPDINYQEYGHHWMYDAKLARETVSTYFEVVTEIFHPGYLLKKIPVLNRLKVFTSDLYYVCTNSKK